MRQEIEEDDNQYDPGAWVFADITERIEGRGQGGKAGTAGPAQGALGTGKEAGDLGDVDSVVPLLLPSADDKFHLFSVKVKVRYELF